MLKSILNLDGAQKVSNEEQKNIYGGTMADQAPVICYCNGERVWDFRGNSCAQVICP